MKTQNADLKTLIGILGGMGPMATLECFKSIIEHTPAEKDQQHFPILVYNNPQIPDRVEAILHGGLDPVPSLTNSAKKLEKAGADFIIMPCNTAHYFFEEIKDAVSIPILDMIEETILKLPSVSKAGLLATDATIRTGIYHQYAKERNIDIVTPDQDFQTIFREVIFGQEGVKAGFAGENLERKMLIVANHLKEKGVGIIIAGCTEVRLVLKDSDIEGAELITPIDVIAEVAVKRANVSFHKG